MTETLVCAALRCAADIIHRRADLSLTGALRTAVGGGVFWHERELPETNMAIFEAAYSTVLAHYRGSVSNADMDPDLPKVLENLAELAELRRSARRAV